MIAQQKTLGWTRKKPRAHYLGVELSRFAEPVIFYF
jgi:hypothetical protein